MPGTPSGAAALPHRVSGIRTQTSGLSSSSAGAPMTPSTPYTPTRSSGFNVPASPSGARAEDEVVVIEVGARGLRIGMAGDATPKANLRPTPALGRRVGDVRQWQVGWRDDWRQRGAVGAVWGKEHELWGADVRGLDLGLVEDKVERLLRDGFARYLLLDSKPRRCCLVFPSSLAIPQVTALLNIVFKKFHALQVSLFSTAAAAAVGAGVRSALVVDLGWAETVVTSVYEYREVRTTRTVRGGKMLVEATHDVLRRQLGGGGSDSTTMQHVVSFDECEEVCTRLMWCKPIPQKAHRQVGPGVEGGGLATVQEQDESDQPAPAPPQSAPLNSPAMVSVPLKSADKPTTVKVPFDTLASACEQTFIAPGQDQAEFDDDELPVHLLIYNHLVQLPVDVRAICMSRIVFTGGCANVLGLRQRIFDELAALAERREWSPITGKHYVNRTKIRRTTAAKPDAGPTVVVTDDNDNDASSGGDNDDKSKQQDSGGSDGSGGSGGSPVGAESEPPEVDPVERELRKHNREQPPVQGTLRVLESTGAWAGASLMAHLRVTAMAQIDKEVWVKQGVAGASKPGEVDVKMQQRHSVGGGGVLKPGEQSWTLGVWGGTS